MRHAHLLGTGAVGRLEQRLREHYGFAYALAVSSATAGLHALALARDLSGHEVVTTPLTYGGTVAGVLHAGGRPMFVDVEPSTLGLDPEAAAAAVGPATRAVLAADVQGVPADDWAIRGMADAHGLWYVHDAAQSFGATRDGRPAGSAAHAVVVSFSPGKTLWAGEGGAVLTDDRALYERLVVLTQHPYRQKREVGLGVADEFGLNLRMHPLAAVCADADFDASLERADGRRQAAEVVLGELRERGLTTTEHLPSLQPTYYRLTVELAPTVTPDEVAQSMGWAAHGVPPSTLQPLYQRPGLQVWDFKTRPCPIAESAAVRRCEIVEELWAG
ncbi:MAG: DegT/DnrJ/EryC1/StrS family aminotransferase [Bacteroidota bacterium]